MSVCLCVVAPLAARAQVVVESQVAVESEEALDALQKEQKKDVVEIETEFMLKANAPVLEQSAPVIRRQRVKEEEPAPERDRVLSEEEVLRVNESLRRAIEQTRRLKEEKQRVDRELGALRGEQRLEQRRVQMMEMQLKDYEDRVAQFSEIKQQVDREMAMIRDRIQAREQALLAHINRLEQELDARAAAGETTADAPQESQPVDDLSGDMDDSLKADATAETGTTASAADIAQAGMDVIELLDDLDGMRQQIRDDEAKLYYNMGNLFFHQAKYEAAVAEYRKALGLLPGDANTHFNLAYISGEFLHDYAAAVEHYQQYLYWNPGAPDKPLVQEKILELQIILSTELGNEKDKELRQNKRMRKYNW